MLKWIGALALGVGLAVPAGAQEAGRFLTVTGEGRVSVAPDIATVEIGVIAEGDDPAAAIDGMSTAMGEVLVSLTEAGIAPADIQSGTLLLHPVYAEPDHTEPHRGPRIAGYRAETQLAVRVRDLDQVGGVLNAAVARGANHLGGLRWELSSSEASEDAALAAAVADAVRKGAIMAEAAGLTLGPIAELREGRVDTGAPQPMMMEARDSAMPLARGEVEVRAEVTARFTLPD